MKKHLQHKFSKESRKRSIPTLLCCLLFILAAPSLTSCTFLNEQVKNKSLGQPLDIEDASVNRMASAIVAKDAEIMPSPTPTLNFDDEGTTFIYESKQYDVKDFTKEMDCISGVEDTEDYLIIRGHCPTAHYWNCYVLFHKESKTFDKEYMGSNLIIVDDAIYYTLWNEILNGTETVIATVDLKEHEWITKLKMTQNKKQFEVRIWNDQYEDEQTRTELVDIV